MAEASKDTIYIDIDDEITSVIEKVRDSKHKILALVLPKRAAVFQSIVNMKLLKRTADEAGKRIVLITSEAGILPLAGAVGLHVAKTLQTKPYIPSAPDVPSSDVALDEPDESDIEEPELDDSKPVGELAGASSLAAAQPDPEETIELDEPDEPAAATGAAGKAAKKKAKKDKKLKVPDFNHFRLRLFLIIGGLVLLIILWTLANIILPKAKITVKTDTTTVNSSVPFTASTATKSLDEANALVPAEQKTVQKTDTDQETATGQKNVGTPATGSVTMTACLANFNLPDSVPAGTSVIANGLTFTTQDTTSFSHAGTPKGSCIQYQANGPTSITAQNSGSNYNLSNASFSVSGRSDVSANGSTSGGTDNVVKVIAQSDIDNAQAKLKTRQDGPATDDLVKALQADNETALTTTLVQTSQNFTSSAKVGDQASSVTVTATTNYSMLGIKQDDLKTLVENDAKKHIDTSKQQIVSDGLGQAQYQVTDKKSPTQMKLTVASTVTAGADINVSSLKQQVAGKKKGDVEQLLQGRPGVQDVTVDLSPFWVGKVPGRTSHITIVIDKPPAINDSKP